ncbi:hypothetical protein SAMN05216302_101152 [Nitrosomonas aestuarii]|uniref:Uncharacterized protein n=1 Tax=Nitrosomonas aestuarii TaxID=52441 RepID=A0A1I4B5S4_9PROT|nr:hypothetical protein [Nitrosomonas aestuarii]SFK64218.1 hypothetical protein SAMN05216302_101152 [Nitrosomonas aestuarii]
MSTKILSGIDMWPFGNKKKRSDIFCFKPKADITADECERIVDDMTPHRFMSEDYVKSLPVSIRRHFAKFTAPGDE